MTTLPFSALAETSLFNFGGFTCVRPPEWRRYMRALIRSEFPDYPGEKASSGQRWKENNCVLAALDAYLLAEFGIFLPQDNLFRIFNADGEGISQSLTPAVISALVEPLGLEIDTLLAPDPELRESLGGEPLCSGLEAAAALDGRAGIAVINIEPGCSHAFFWPRMSAARFDNDRFRLALTLRAKNGSARQLSLLSALETYTRRAKEGLACACPSAEAAALSTRLDALLAFAYAAPDRRSPEFRAAAESSLAGINHQFRRTCARTPEQRLTADLGDNLRRVLREATAID